MLNPVTGSIVAAIGSSLLGGIFGNKANKDREKLSREQMAFQERMSSTAYQRAIADMQSAGLNPMLAYSQGGASSPVGSMPQVNNIGQEAVSSAASAMQAMQAMQGIQLSQAQAEKVRAETAKIESETMDKELNVEALDRRIQLMVEQGNLLLEQARSQSVSRDQMRANTAVQEVMEKLRQLELDRDTSTFSADVARRKADSLRATVEAELRQLEIPRGQAEEEFWKNAGPSMQWLRMILDVLRGAASARSLGR